jgi:hypothetical protein
MGFIILPTFFCRDYWTDEEDYIKAMNEEQAIQIFKDETGATLVKCHRVD